MGVPMLPVLTAIPDVQPPSLPPALAAASPLPELPHKESPQGRRLQQLVHPCLSNVEHRSHLPAVCMSCIPADQLQACCSECSDASYAASCACSDDPNAGAGILPGHTSSAARCGCPAAKGRASSAAGQPSIELSALAHCACCGAALMCTPHCSPALCQQVHCTAQGCCCSCAASACRA